jgi:hypothetical protein
MKTVVFIHDFHQDMQKNLDESHILFGRLRICTQSAFNTIDEGCPSSTPSSACICLEGCERLVPLERLRPAASIYIDFLY